MPPSSQTQLSDRILSKLRKSKRKYSLPDKLEQSLGVSSAEFHRAVDHLVGEGLVVRASKGRLGLCDRLDLISGTLQVGRSGKAVLIPDVPDAPIRIDGNRLRPAMDRDRLLVEVEPYRSGRGLRKGTIHSILERGRDSLVGVVSEVTPGTLEPYGRPLGYIVSLRGDAGSLKPGETVAARIVDYPRSHADITAEVERVLGRSGDMETEIRAACFVRGIPEEFTPEALELAERLPEPRADDLVARTDLRNQTTVTIDGADARDFDDAVAIEKKGDGFRLTVSIADVSHYVRPNDALDRAAFERGTSVYFPSRAVPMLPEALSNNLASLVEGKDRLTVSAILDVDADGDVTDTGFATSVIKSAARLTYDEVEQVIQGDQTGSLDPQITSSLHEMARCAEILRRKRMTKGSLDFDLPEATVVIDDGVPVSVIKRPRLNSHRLIEEFMIAANEAVARHLTSRRLGFLYRIHERPPEDKTSELGKRLSGFGVRLNTSGRDLEPVNLQAVLEKAAGKPHEQLINLLVLRALSQARYSAYGDIHFGLASSCYTHFTSPIRRYPDLLTHRALVAELTGRADEIPSPAALEPVADHCSRCERRATDAERDIVRAATVLVMQSHVGLRMSGRVSSVERFGYFVELDEIYAEGFVPIGRLSEYYEFIRERMELTSRVSNKTIRVGDATEIVVTAADLPTRTLEFEPARDSRS